MLYVSDEVRKSLARLSTEMQDRDPIEAANRLLAVLPEYGPAYLLIGIALRDAGKVDEAEAALWTGLGHEPCNALLYIELAALRTARDPADVLAQRIRHLGLWKL